MTTAIVTLPDNRRARVTFDSQEQLDAVIADLTGTGGGWGRQAGLAARSAVQGALGLPALLADAIAAPVNIGAQAIGSDFRLQPTRETIGGLLDEAGVPSPVTQAERAVGRVAEMGYGAIVGLGLGMAGRGATEASRVLAANPLQQVAASTLSPAVGEGLRAAGVPSPVATGAEVLTSLAVPSDASLRGIVSRKGASGAIRNTAAGAATRTAPARALGGAKEILTTEGRQNIVGRILRAGARNPEEAARLLDDIDTLVPGSRPTMGQAAGDVGLLRLESIAENTIDVPGVVSQPGRLANARDISNRARRATVENLRPVSAKDDALRRSINARFRKPLEQVMESRKPVPTAQVVSEIDALLATPGLRQRSELTAHLEYVKERLTALGDMADPMDVQAVRQDVADLVEGALKGAATRDGRALDGGVKGLSREIMRKQVIPSIDNLIEMGAPGYKAKWLVPYSAARQKLTQRQIVGEARSAAQTTAIDSEGLPILSSAGLSRWIEKNPRKMAQLSPQQRSTLVNVQKDLARGARGNSASVQGSGSSTAKNIVGGASIASIIGRALGGGPQREPFPLGDKFKFLFGYTDREINELLIEAMLDPKLGQKLLKQANEEAVSEAAQMLEDLATRRATIASQTNLAKD